MRSKVNKIMEYMKNVFHPAISIFARVDNSRISKKAKIYRFARVVDSKIGDYSYVGIGSWVCVAEVGKFCSIASNVNIGLGNHTMNFLSTSPIFTEKKNATGFSWIEKTIAPPFKRTSIGNDVWIGYGALIIGGVTIGDGAVIGAGSVVTKDVPPFAIVAGVPAKIIKFRFSENQINSILKESWWNKPDEELKKEVEIFQNRLD